MPDMVKTPVVQELLDRVEQLEIRIHATDARARDARDVTDSIVSRITALELRADASEAAQKRIGDLEDSLTEANRSIAALQSWIHDFCMLSDRNSTQAQMPCPDGCGR